MLDLVHGNQRVGVFLARFLDDLAGLAPFDQLAVAQHHDLVGHLGDDGEVVGDVERGDAGIADRVLDRGQHVDLRRHVERGGRLVEDDQVRLRAQRHGRHDALELAAGDLVRVAAPDRLWIGQAELAEQFDGAPLGLLAGRGAVPQRRLDDLVHQAVRRVEGGSRRLRDIADLAAAQLAQPRHAALEDVAAVEDDLATGDLHAAAAITHRRQADGRLAGAGLADEAEHLALVELERDAVDDRHLARIFSRGIDRRLDLQVPDVEQELARIRV